MWGAIASAVIGSVASNAIGSLFGGGGSSSRPAPAPDSALTAESAAGRRIANTAAQRVFDMGDANNARVDELTGLAVQRSQDSYDRLRDLYDYVAQQRGLYGGLTQRALDDAALFNQADWQQRYAQQAGEDVTAATQRAWDTTQRQMAGLGLRPGSPAYASMLQRTNLAGAMGSAQAYNMAREAARQLGLQYQDRASGMLNQGAQLYGNLGGSLATSMQNAATSPLSAYGMGLQAKMLPYSTAGNLGNAVSNSANDMFRAQASFNVANTELGQKAGNPAGTMFGTAMKEAMTPVYKEIGEGLTNNIRSWFNGGGIWPA